MESSRRALLRTAGLGGAIAVAGCLDRVLPGTDAGPPAYLTWLSRPGRLVSTDAYRVAILRPREFPEAERRLRPFLPDIPVPSVDPTAVDRLLVGAGATVCTGVPSQQTIVEEYRDHGYEYQRGIGDFWVLSDGKDETPLVAAADNQLILAWPTPSASPDAVIDTLVYGSPAETGWISDRPEFQDFTTQLGTPPAVALDFRLDSGPTAPRRGHFTGAQIRAVTTDPGGPRRTYAALFMGGTPAESTIQAWVDAALTDLSTAEITTDGAIVTVEGSLPESWGVRTRFPAADRRWNGRDADAMSDASLPDGAPPRNPIRERWRLERPDAGRTSAPPAVKDGVVFATADDCYALDARDGHILWRAGLEDAAGTPVLAGGFVIVPGVVDGAGAIVALDPSTGAQEWVSRPPHGPIDALVGHGTRVYLGTSQRSTPSPIDIDDGSDTANAADPDVWPSGDPGVVALEATTGEREWRWPNSASHLAVTANTVVCGDAKYQDDESSLAALNPSTGRANWTNTYCAPLSDLAIATGQGDPGPILVATSNAVIGVESTEGEYRWSYHPGESLRIVGMAIAEGEPYVASTRSTGAIPEGADPGQLTRLDGAEGEVYWRQGTRRRPRHRPVVVGDEVFLVEAAGALTSYARSDGTGGWAVYTAGDLGLPAIVGESVYLHTDAIGLAALGRAWRPAPRRRFIRSQGPNLPTSNLS